MILSSIVTVRIYRHNTIIRVYITSSIKESFAFSIKRKDHFVVLGEFFIALTGFIFFIALTSFVLCVLDVEPSYLHKNFKKKIFVIPVVYSSLYYICRNYKKKIPQIVLFERL